METDIERQLKLTNWRDGNWFNKPGIGFDVLEEDGKTVQKQFTATSRRLIRALKPLIVKAEDNRQDTISVSILRSGEGLDTRYAVKEILNSQKRGEHNAR